MRGTRRRTGPMHSPDTRVFPRGLPGYSDRSLVKAAQVVRDPSVVLAHTRGRRIELTGALTTIQQVLLLPVPMNTRSAHPNTYQLILNPDD